VTESELLASLAATKLESSPGTTFRYSNLGAALEGLVIARVAGEPYAEHVEAHLLRPLGMATATFDRGKIPGQALATSYLRDGTGAPAKVATPLREGATAARGQLYATIGDVAKLASFELRAWPARDEPDPGPVRRATVRESQRTIGPFPPVTHTKGAGWFLDATPRGAIVSHGGAGEGFMTELWLSTSANLAFAILINDDDPGIARLARHAQELLLPRIASPLELVVRLLDDPSEATARQLVEPDYLIGMRSRGSLAKLASLHANLGACSVASTDATEASEDRELVHGTIACGTRTLSVSVASTDTDPAQIAFLRIE
jgi:CubicO group peptidase (beta-lactamase class C family)